MSKNTTIRKGDKKFIRLEKARIRRQFSDLVKQEEMINELYKRFTKTPNTVVKEKPVSVKVPAVAKAVAGKEKPQKAAAKKIISKK